MEIPNNDRRVLKINDKEVVIDTKNLMFNEVTLSDFFQKSAAWYDNIGRALADAEALVQFRKMELDRISGEKFDTYKTEGKASDKLAGARADGDKDVIEAKTALVGAQLKVSLIKNHLRAWDKAFDNAQSTGHMLRKEMDKLNYHTSRLEDTLEDALGEEN